MVMIRMTVTLVIVMVMVGIMAAYSSVTLIVSGRASTWSFPCPWFLGDAIGRPLNFWVPTQVYLLIS
jgi:hypothetical protein